MINHIPCRPTLRRRSVIIIAFTFTQKSLQYFVQKRGKSTRSGLNALVGVVFFFPLTLVQFVWKQFVHLELNKSSIHYEATNPLGIIIQDIFLILHELLYDN